jgi:arsenate reductase
MTKANNPKTTKKIIFHKESCITCKKSIAEIQSMKIDMQKRDFFKQPFSEAELKKIIKMTGMGPREMIRKRDKMFKELEIETKKFTDDQIIKLMVKHPGLIARPIIISNNKVFVGKTSIENLKKG